MPRFSLAKIRLFLQVLKQITAIEIINNEEIVWRRLERISEGQNKRMFYILQYLLLQFQTL